MPVLEQDYEDGVLKQTRVNFLGARGIEAIITVDHTRNDQASLQWLFYDGHGNVVRTMSNDGLFRLSAFQWRGVWGERESDLGLGRGYCANLGHPEDETGLVYMRARYYEPATGRFISEDPGRDGVNWYLYADGNPVNKVDYSGENVLWSIAFHALALWEYANNNSMIFRNTIAFAFVNLMWLLVGETHIRPMRVGLALTVTGAWMDSNPRPGGIATEVRAFYSGLSAIVELTIIFLFMYE